MCSTVLIKKFTCKWTPIVQACVVQGSSVLSILSGIRKYKDMILKFSLYTNGFKHFDDYMPLVFLFFFFKVLFI